MQKYLTVLKLSWSEGLAYPLSVLLWRFRQMLITVMSLSVWTVIYTQQSSVAGYDRNQMISYIFLVSILQGAILSTSLHGVAGQIWSGAMSNLLTKPLQLFRYYGTMEVADKAKNVFFIIGELILLAMVYRPQLVIPGLAIIALFLVWTLLGILMHFFIELLFGALGFWSNEVWGPKFLFFMMIEATVGKLFPLDIMPQWFQTMFAYTPLPYLSYSQTQLFLGRIPTESLLPQTLAMIVWTIVLFFVCKYVWNKGIRSYAAAGS